MISSSVPVHQAVYQLRFEQPAESDNVAGFKLCVRFWREKDIGSKFRNIGMLDWVLVLTPTELATVVPVEVETMGPVLSDRVEIIKRLSNRAGTAADNAGVLVAERFLSAPQIWQFLVKD